MAACGRENFHSGLLYSNNIRKPLRTLSANVPSTSKQHPNEYRVVKVEKNPTIKITQTRGVGQDDEVFIDGNEHYVKWEPHQMGGHKISNGLSKSPKKMVQKELNPNLAVIRREVRSRSDGHIRMKEGLLRRISSRAIRIKNDFNDKKYFAMFIYNNEYFTDHYEYYLRTEIRWALREDALRKADSSIRMQVIDWLIYAQQQLQQLESTYFAAIRLFDFILVSKELNKDNYCLAAITALWIMNKNFEHRLIPLSKLFTLCNAKYSRRQFKEMEFYILKIISFKIYVPEPLEFIHYFLQKFKFCYSTNIPLAASFVMECVSLFPKFSSNQPTILACAALYFGFKMIPGIVFDEKYFLESVHTLYPMSVFKQFLGKVNAILACVLKENFPFQEVIKKYQSPAKGNIVQYFIHR